jgi:hypothetical protein
MIRALLSPQVLFYMATKSFLKPYKPVKKFIAVRLCCVGP